MGRRARGLFLPGHIILLSVGPLIDGFVSEHYRDVNLDVLMRHFSLHRLSLIGHCLMSNCPVVVPRCRSHRPKDRGRGEDVGLGDMSEDVGVKVSGFDQRSEFSRHRWLAAEEREGHRVGLLLLLLSATVPLQWPVTVSAVVVMTSVVVVMMRRMVIAAMVAVVVPRGYRAGCERIMSGYRASAARVTRG